MKMDSEIEAGERASFKRELLVVQIQLLLHRSEI